VPGERAGLSSGEAEFPECLVHAAEVVIEGAELREFLRRNFRGDLGLGDGIVAREAADFFP